jgi:hypothetical protein
LSNAERNKFLNADIDIRLLENYTEEEKHELFQRLQIGKTLTVGEKLKSITWKGSEAVYENQYVKKFETLLEKLKLGLKRGEFNKLISQLCVMIIDDDFGKIDSFEKITECLLKAKFESKIEQLEVILECFCTSFEDKGIAMLRSEILTIFWCIKKVESQCSSTVSNRTGGSRLWIQQY